MRSPSRDEHRGRSQRPLHVMHLVSVFGCGGMEVGVSKLANGCARDRVRISICSLAPARADRPALREDVPLHELTRRSGADVRLIGRLRRLFRREHVDIVHTHNWGTLCEGLVAARLAGTPVLLHGEHGTMEMRPRNRRVQHWAWNRADRVLSVSSRLADKMAAHVGFPRPRIQVIRNGVDLERFALVDRRTARSTLGLPVDDILVGTIGRLHVVKNQEGLVRAVGALRRSGLPVSVGVVGDGELRGHLQEVAREVGIDQAAHFLGHRDDVERLLPAFDIFALPSRSEGLSNTILEAMAAGVAVVATRVGGADELVVDGTTGVLVPPDDQAELEHALAKLIRDARLRHDMARAGRQRAAASFSLQRMIQAYEALYVDLFSAAVRDSEPTYDDHGDPRSHTPRAIVER